MQALSMAIAANAVCKTERFMWCVLPVEFLGSPFFAGLPSTQLLTQRFRSGLNLPSFPVAS
jgi:hypothetical protein